jgi:hypothetical protein
MLFFSLLYNFIKNFTVLNVECFYYCIITVPALCVCVCVCVCVCDLLSHSQDTFILCVIQPFLFVCRLLYFTGKLASKIFRKVCRKELNLLLVALSIEADS